MIVTAEGRVSTKKARIQKLKVSTQKTTISPAKSYVKNNQNEILCQEIASHVVQILLKKAPYLVDHTFVTVNNEYQVPKCVCTTLKPELLPYPTLHDAANCAEFVAHYFNYEPLDDPLMPPLSLPSPSQVISWHNGDCFDMAVVLVSFLLGAGYDAYVVYGTAPKWICDRDRSNLIRPGVQMLSQELQEEVNIVDALRALVESGEDSSSLMSSQDGCTQFKSRDEESLNIDPISLDPMHGKRVHCWVLVKANARCPSSSLDYFIEPSTGFRYSVDEPSCPYLSVRAVWNTQNYWINIHEQGSTSNAHFDFSDTDSWAPVFLNRGLENCYKYSDTSRMPFDPPFSWVKPLIIPEELFRFKYPRTGHRVILYNKAKIELFANGIQKQGIEKRITTFRDEDLHHPTCHAEYFFECRKDGLRKRIRLPELHCFCEKFTHTNEFSIEEWIEISGSRRKIIFNHKRRPDGLKTCEEIQNEEGVKVSCLFDDRQDRLMERTVFSKVAHCEEDSHDCLLLQFGDEIHKNVVIKIIEKYGRPLVIKDTMKIIASRVLHLKEGQIETEYFDVTDSIDKERDMHGKENSHSNISEEDAQSLEQRQKLVKIEKEMVTAVHKLHQEILKLSQIRRREESVSGSTALNVQTASDDLTSKEVKSSDTTKTSHASVHDDNVDAEGHHNDDYLAPFLLSGLFAKDPDNISAEEAYRIRESCIATMKERLLERTNIINERLLEENKRLDTYRENGNANGCRQEEFDAMCNNLSFKIKILEKRLESQEGRSLNKISDLKTKLAKDKRLQSAVNDDNFIHN